MFFYRYIPPLLWGKSGHLQTALYGKLGRVSSPHPNGVRKYLPMLDGATATFDLFEPVGNHRTGGEEDFNLIILFYNLRVRLKTNSLFLHGLH